NNKFKEPSLKGNSIETQKNNCSIIITGSFVIHFLNLDLFTKSFPLNLTSLRPKNLIRLPLPDTSLKNGKP
ncbi:Uncharacterized protein APZ42_005767, partial [Daphnia magna]